MKIIAHRGEWLSSSEKNTEIAFRRALENGFGIETDLRDFCQGLVISHDIPNETSMAFDIFLNIVREYPLQTLALNIKSDGLQQLIKNRLIDFSNNYFCFDMSTPDLLGFLKLDIPSYTRSSDIESPSLLEETVGVWFDNFHSNQLDVEKMHELLKIGKEVCLVSPELHNYEYVQYWQELKHYLHEYPKHRSRIGICTDYPTKAKEFFK